MLLWGIEGQCDGLFADKTNDDAKPSQAQPSQAEHRQWSLVDRPQRHAAGRRPP